MPAKLQFGNDCNDAAVWTTENRWSGRLLIPYGRTDGTDRETGARRYIPRGPHEHCELNSVARHNARDHPPERAVIPHG